ncbi:hypothetical protein CesoFtcFv8_007214 [Champsocephalus esox]|uniref:Uncharacterized protein n=1 Tax=Champsocephalus esox TaxID=159716 RepID=A0AAN8CDV8_9TELE|nr:hypothetical protein CesoFtcFv8_007214 [Champsocephalus esox]
MAFSSSLTEMWIKAGRAATFRIPIRHFPSSVKFASEMGFDFSLRRKKMWPTSEITDRQTGYRSSIK